MKHISYIAVGAMLTLMAACSSSATDDITPTDDSVKARHLVITQTADEASRAILTENGTTLAASWKSGDELSYYNFNYEYDASAERFVHATGTLTATTTAATSSFEGTVQCTTGDAIAVVYPTAGTISEVSGYGATKAKYAITLSGQDGTLATLAESFHYVYGVATVTAVTENTATATMGTTTSLLTVCKFSFVDEQDNPIAVRSLNIGYGGSGSDNGTYPQTATVTCSDDKTVSVAGGSESMDGKSLTINVEAGSTLTEVFVALLPTGADARTFCFTATDGSGNTYYGEADAKLNAGEYVVATGLRLTKQ